MGVSMGMPRETLARMKFGDMLTRVNYFNVLDRRCRVTIIKIKPAGIAAAIREYNK